MVKLDVAKIAVGTNLHIDTIDFLGCPAEYRGPITSVTRRDDGVLKVCVKIGRGKKDYMYVLIPADGVTRKQITLS